MQQEPPPHRYHLPKSVSDLYGTGGGDEIDFLLDEIKDLEPACCQLEDLQVHDALLESRPDLTLRQQIDDQNSDNFIIVVPSPKLPTKRNAASAFLDKFLRRPKQQQQHELVEKLSADDVAQADEAQNKSKKKRVNLVTKPVVYGEVAVKDDHEDVGEDDDGIVPISIGENDAPEDENKADASSGIKSKDFDIAGSRAGEISLLESPLGTVTSWDSHAFYRQRIGLSQMTWGVQLHCDSTHLKTSTGIVRILLVLSSAICLACECSAGTLQVGLFLLPLIGRLRLMVFCALFSLLVTCLMLFLDISHIALMFPFNWSKVNAWLYLSISLLFIISSSLFVHMVLFAEAFAWVPRHTKDTLFVSAIFGYLCALEGLILSALALCKSAKYLLHVSEEQSELCAQDREMGPLTRNHKSDRRSTRRGENNSLANNHLNNVTEQHIEEEIGRGEEDDDDDDENQRMLDGQANHRGRSSFSSYSQSKPYIPAKRPDQAYNKPATLGHQNNSNVKTSNRYRQGYHYQPIASTSQQQSPTFVLDDAIPGSSRA